MTEQQFGPQGEKVGRRQAPADAVGRSESSSSVARGNAATTTAAAGAAGSSSKPGGQAVVGTFTLRDLVALGAVLVTFIGSLLPIFRAGYTVNLWNGASLFFVGIGIVLPLIVAGLFLARRLAAQSTFRVGSLSVDQFGSVVASFATAYFFLSLVSNFSLGFLIALIGSLGLLAATVAAPWLPFFAADFTGRPASAAHPVARNAVPPAPKPAPAPKSAAAPKQTFSPKPAVGQPAAPNAAGSNAASSPAAGSNAAGSTGAGSAAATPNAAGSADAGPHAGGSTAVSASSGAASPASSAPRGVSQQPGTAGPARPAASSDPVAAAPELSQFVGGAAAGGAVSAAAQSLPAEGQTSEGNRQGAPAQQGPKGPVQQGPTGAGGRASEGAGGGTSDGAGARSASEPKTNAPAQGTGADVAAAAVEPVDESLKGVPPTTVNPTVNTSVQARRESISATVDPASRSESGGGHDQHGRQNEETDTESAHASAYDAFWFAVDRPRPIVDEKTGGFLYNVEPGNWILALQDRGHDFLVQNTDGRVGVLRDLRNIERAPEGE